MAYKLYDYLEKRGDKLVNVIKEWTQGLQTRDRARLNEKLDKLAQHGTGLPPKLLSDTGAKHIKKLRITGRKVPTLRPMLCQGPIDNANEFTLLQGAIEKDGTLIPSDALKLAQGHRNIIINDPTRRCPHERIS